MIAGQTPPYQSQDVPGNASCVFSSRLQGHVDQAGRRLLLTAAMNMVCHAAFASELRSQLRAGGIPFYVSDGESVGALALLRLHFHLAPCKLQLMLCVQLMW